MMARVTSFRGTGASRRGTRKARFTRHAPNTPNATTAPPQRRILLIALLVSLRPENNSTRESSRPGDCAVTIPRGPPRVQGARPRIRIKSIRSVHASTSAGGACRLDDLRALCISTQMCGCPAETAYGKRYLPDGTKYRYGETCDQRKEAGWLAICQS